MLVRGAFWTRPRIRGGDQGLRGESEDSRQHWQDLVISGFSTSARSCAGGSSARLRRAIVTQNQNRCSRWFYQFHPEPGPQTEKNQSGTEENFIGTTIIPELVSLNLTSPRRRETVKMPSMFRFKQGECHCARWALTSQKLWEQGSEAQRVPDSTFGEGQAETRTQRPVSGGRRKVQDD